MVVWLDHWAGIKAENCVCLESSGYQLTPIRHMMHRLLEILV